MSRIVQKYGGSSLADVDRIRRVADRIREARNRYDGVCVVVSAMGDTTDELIQLAHQLTDDPPAREMDMLMSTGEMQTAPLLAMRLCALGCAAVSLTGLQAGIRTSGTHRKARIVDIVPERIVEALDEGTVPVIAGFQGVSESFDITTLGRGGSDTSAVALAAALGADHCEIYTDVRGVYTADPRIVPDARPIPEISYEEMLEFSAVGAKVMHPRAVEIGEAYDIPIWVRSSFEESPGTIITRHPKLEDRQKVRGIAQETDVAKLTLLRVPDRPGIAAAIFGPLAERHVNVDVILHHRRNRHARRAGHGRRDRPRDRGGRRRGDRQHRQSVGRGNRDAQHAGNRRDDVPHARRGGDQHPAHLDERDPHHLHHRPVERPAGGAGAASGLRTRRALAVRSCSRAGRTVASTTPPRRARS
jgi:aspartate kinase